ncbi:MAG: IS66 family insertion sequence element accessory protein TnpA [Bacteroidota bacterium]
MRKIKTHTRAEMFAHILACKESGLSKRAYCNQHDIACSTFQYWAKKYREEHSDNKPEDTNPGFIPVQVQPDPRTDQVNIHNRLHFLFPNGVQVMCTETVNPEVLKTLLNP